MDAISVLLNEAPISIQDRREIIQELKNDDEFLIDYICRASVRSQRIPFCSVEDLPNLSISRVEETTLSCLPGPSTLHSIEKVIHTIPSAQDADMSRQSSVSTILLCLPGSSTSDPVEESSITSTETQYEQYDEEIISNFSPPPRKIDIWISKGRASSEDKEAIFEMLQLRASQKYVTRFNDKSSVKLELWKEISNMLQNLGFNVDAKSCRQKLANLYNKYTKFKQHNKTTGCERKEPPEFDNIMGQILGDKDKVNLKYVIDTIDQTEDQTNRVLQKNTHILDDIVESIDISTNEKRQPADEIPESVDQEILQSKSSNKAGEKFTTIKKKIAKSDILGTITASQKQQRQEQESQFREIMNVLSEQNLLLREQNTQRDQFLSIMREFVKPKKKRKRGTRSSDSGSD